MIPNNYEQFICLYLNVEYARSASVLDMVDATLMASGEIPIPRAWDGD